LNPSPRVLPCPKTRRPHRRDHRQMRATYSPSAVDAPVANARRRLRGEQLSLLLAPLNARAKDSRRLRMRSKGRVQRHQITNTNTLNRSCAFPTCRDFRDARRELESPSLQFAIFHLLVLAAASGRARLPDTIH